jgi:calcium-activated chloride channel regulator 4
LCSEEYYHDVSQPSKQNLFCDGRSTWNVISSSPDFADNLNPPNPDITNTDPTFVLVGGEASQVAYVLVMDISSSMVDMNRFVPMTDAAKRWIQFQVQDGVELGMVAFADEEWYFPVMNLTQVTDQSRTDMIAAINTLKPYGKTCIGCGLSMAKDYPYLLKGKTGNTIVLITDGQQNCLHPTSTGCLTIANVLEDLVARKIRVITIALGDEADPEIEDLAVATGGKSYYVEDNSGAGDINDAFSGRPSLGCISNSNIILNFFIFGQRAWKPGA